MIPSLKFHLEDSVRGDEPFLSHKEDNTFSHGEAQIFEYRLGPHIQLVLPLSPPYEGEEGGEANYSCVWKHFWRQ